MDSFLKLLEETAKYIRNEADLSHIKSGEAFEKYVVDTMKELSEKNSELPSKDEINQTGKNSFPDIVIGDRYGIEVKFSKSGKWESLGNSIFEGTSVGELEEIYLLFGRKDSNKIEVKYKRYEDSLVEVKVTHSPRFMVSMEAEESIFDKLHIPYEQFKTMDKIKKGKEIKSYFRSNLKQGEEVWFLESEESETSVTITSFKNLDEHLKDKLLIEAYILFPEVFSSSPNKYAGVSTYWITKYQVYNSALRDKFSASGKEKINLPKYGQVKVKKIYKNLFKLSKQIRSYIDNVEEDFIELVIEKWGATPETINSKNLLSKWIDLLDGLGVDPSEDTDQIMPSDVFIAGLNG